MILNTKSDLFQKMSRARSRKEMLEVACGAAANAKSAKLSKILESTIDLIIDKAEVSSSKLL